MARPFRFGVSVRHAEDGDDWREKARRAEGLGYSVFLVPDHLAEILPPWVALTVAAEAAPTMRVGSFVLRKCTTCTQDATRARRVSRRALAPGRSAARCPS